MPAELPHFLLPFTITRGGYALEVEQESDQEIQQSVWSALAYQPGQRIDRPDFGLPDQVFVEGGANLDRIRDVILEWEPRADEVLDADKTWLSTAVQTITVRRISRG